MANLEPGATTAAGTAVARGGRLVWGPGAKEGVRPEVIAALEAAARAGYSFTVTTGVNNHDRYVAGTTRESLHYSGRAVDITTLNGARVTANNTAVSGFMAFLQGTKGAEVIGPGSKGHDTHVHFGMGGASGGTRSATGATGMAVDAPLPPNATDAQITAYFKEHYPSLAPFMEVAELKKLFVQYARDRRDVGWLNAQLRGTKWWKSQSAEARARFVEERSDPGEAKDSLEEKMAIVRASAEEFLLPMSDTAIRGWATHLLRDSKSAEDFENYLRQQAAGLYQPFAEQILAGVDPKTLLDPYKALATQTLEKPVDYRDMNLRVLQTQYMNLGDYRTYLRSRPEWRQTANYREEDAQTALFLEQQMGLRA